MLSVDHIDDLGVLVIHVMLGMLGIHVSIRFMECAIAILALLCSNILCEVYRKYWPKDQLICCFPRGYDGNESCGNNI